MFKQGRMLQIDNSIYKSHPQDRRVKVGSIKNFNLGFICFSFLQSGHIVFDISLLSQPVRFRDLRLFYCLKTKSSSHSCCFPFDQNSECSRIGNVFHKLMRQIGNPVDFELPDWFSKWKPMPYTFIRRSILYYFFLISPLNCVLFSFFLKCVLICIPWTFSY